MVETRQADALAINGVFIIFAFLFVTGRLYSRYLGQNFGWDDHLIVAAFVLLFGQTIGSWKYILLSGTGYHTWDLPKMSVEEQLVANNWNFAVQMLYHPLMGAIRASIIMFLFRMMDQRRRIRYSLHVVFWLNVAYTISTFLINILQCNPIRYVWAKPAMDSVDAQGNLVAGGTCINSRTFILTSCALSIFMDLIIIPIPSIMVWNLHMDRKTKFLVVIVMSLGWVATAVSVGRFVVYYYRFAPTNTDRTWNIGLVISVAEPAVHIMTACAPATKCLFRYLFPYFLGSRTSPYYEERSSTKQTNLGKSGSRASRRRTRGFHFGTSHEGVSDDLDVEQLGPSDTDVVEDRKGAHGYAMERLDSAESLQTIQDSRVDRRQSVDVQNRARSSCSRTAHTERSEPIEAEPRHCLADAK